MREPNFSEAQLQQAVNISIARCLFETHGHRAYPFIPSLVAEFDLGWDSAFYLPWIPYSPRVDHEGANLFIQYKLAHQLGSSGAKQWSNWSQPYLRFKIPHSTKNSAGTYMDDYHQWDALKALANEGYPTYYVSNHTIDKTELRDACIDGTLVDKTPFMDVRDVAVPHKFVTFTEQSGHFFLHSEPVKVARRDVRHLAAAAGETQYESTQGLNTRLFTTLRRIGADDETWQASLTHIEDFSFPDAERLPSRLRPLAKLRLLRQFVLDRIGAAMLTVPRP